MLLLLMMMVVPRGSFSGDDVSDDDHKDGDISLNFIDIDENNNIVHKTYHNDGEGDDDDGDLEPHRKWYSHKIL